MGKSTLFVIISVACGIIVRKITDDTFATFAHQSIMCFLTLGFSEVFEFIKEQRKKGGKQ